MDPRVNKETLRRKSPSVPSGDLNVVSVEELIAGSPLDECRAENLDLASRTVRSLIASSSIVKRVSFANCEFGALRLRDVRLVQCDLSNAVLRGFEARRVEFLDCRLLGMRAIECRWQDVLIQNCDGRYAQFNEGQLRNCEFTGTNLEEADLSASDLQGTVFRNVALNRADLRRAKLQDADLRGAEIEGIIIEASNVEGAVVSVAQALDLTRLLGIVIK